jgi:hypothetical protein
VKRHMCIRIVRFWRSWPLGPRLMNPLILAGTRKGLNLRLSALLDGESAGWGSDAGVEGAI